VDPDFYAISILQDNQYEVKSKAGDAILRESRQTTKYGISSTELRTKYYCTGEGQQQYTRLDAVLLVPAWITCFMPIQFSKNYPRNRPLRPKGLRDIKERIIWTIDS
jgi:hypothetical protein